VEIVIAAPSARRRPVGAEERAQLLRVELGLLERREVPAACGLGHAHDVRRTLEPRPRRAADVAGEQREAGRRLDPAGVLRGRDRGVRAAEDTLLAAVAQYIEVFSATFSSCWQAKLIMS
jgi:hypothetical protein